MLHGRALGPSSAGPKLRVCCRAAQAKASSVQSESNSKIQEARKDGRIPIPGPKPQVPQMAMRSLDGFDDDFDIDLMDELTSDLATTVHAIILAGGASDNPLARMRAIPALPLGGTYTLIDVAIGNCLRSGVNKLHVLTQFNSHLLTTYLSKMYPPMSFGGIANASFVDSIACTQTPLDSSWAKGSADAVRRALPKLVTGHSELPPPQDILILTGEDVFEVDVRAILAQHRRTNSDITLLTHSASRADFDTKHFGVVRTDLQTGQVAEFVEKPELDTLDMFAHTCATATVDRPYEVSMGMYVFKRTALEALINSERGLHDCHFGYDTVPAAITEGYKVTTAHQTNTWQKCSDLKSYYQTNIDLACLDRMPKVFDYMRAAANSGRSLPPTRMSNIEIDRAFVGDGSVLIGGRIARSVVGTNSYIGANCDIEDSVINGLSFFHTQALHQEWRARDGNAPGIGANVVLRKVLLDLDASIGDDVHLINKAGILEADMPEKGIIVRDGIVVVPQGCKVVDGFRF